MGPEQSPTPWALHTNAPSGVGMLGGLVWGQHWSSDHAEHHPHPLLTPHCEHCLSFIPSRRMSDVGIAPKPKPNQSQHYSRHLKQKVQPYFPLRESPPPPSKLSLKRKRSLLPLPQRAQRAAGTTSDHRAAPGLLEKALAAPVRKAATELSSCSPLTVAILVNHNAIKYKEPAWGGAHPPEKQSPAAGR